MGEVRAVTGREVHASAQAVFAALADYAAVRPKLLPEQFSGYGVRVGGMGAGTVVGWRLQATKKRARDVVVSVSEPAPLTLVEWDANSSMVTTWSVEGHGDHAHVSVESVWSGASGVGGFFERAFAPRGLNRINDRVLANLAALVES